MAGNIKFICDKKHRSHFTMPSCSHPKTNQVAVALSIDTQEKWTLPRKMTLSILKKTSHTYLRYLLQISASSWFQSEHGRWALAGHIGLDTLLNKGVWRYFECPGLCRTPAQGWQVQHMICWSPPPFCSASQVQTAHLEARKISKKHYPLSSHILFKSPINYDHSLATQRTLRHLIAYISIYMNWIPTNFLTFKVRHDKSHQQKYKGSAPKNNYLCIPMKLDNIFLQWVRTSADLKAETNTVSQKDIEIVLKISKDPMKPICVLAVL